MRARVVVLGDARQTMQGVVREMLDAQLVVEQPLAVARDDDVRLVPEADQLRDEALGVDRAGGACDADDMAAAGLDVRFIVASVLMVLFAADGRWMSISLVWRLLAGRGSGVRAWMDGARLVNAGAGMAQSAMLVLALAGGLLDAALAASAVVGVFAIELMPDLRVRVARKAALELQQE